MSKKKSLNLLGLPKDLEFMKCFGAPPGTVLMQADVAALEPHVLAFFSKDPTLYSVYGPDAWPHHDIYFIAGMRIPGLGEKIREHYTLENPTLEGINYLKNHYNKERKGMLKPAYLGWCYGLGAETLSINLEIPESQARRILTGIDKQFPAKVWLQKHLLKQWRENDGYVIDGRGMPTCVDFGKKKDIVNRVVQKTGHEILQRILYHIQKYRLEHDVPMRPYIPDYHDESLWAVKIGHEEEAARAMDYGFDKINEELGWDIKIKHSGITFGPDMRVRCEDYVPETA